MNGVSALLEQSSGGEGLVNEHVWERGTVRRSGRRTGTRRMTRCCWARM